MARLLANTSAAERKIPEDQDDGMTKRLKKQWGGVGEPGYREGERLQTWYNDEEG